MAIVPIQLARVSNNLRMTLAQRNLSKTQQSLLNVQNELTTGKRLNTPSDAPADAAIALTLRKTLEQRAGFADNLRHATSQLSEVDNSLAGLTDLLREAQTVASANVGSDVTADEREAAAAVIDSLFTQALSLANRQFDGQYLFGGDAGVRPFEVTSAGVQYLGRDTVLENSMDQGVALPFQVSGQDVFAAITTRVKGNVDLTPAVNGSTRLDSLGGAQGNSIALGSIQLGNGSTTRIIDLSAADNLDDIVDAINGAAVGGITASIDAANHRLVLSAGAGDNITVTELGGTTAADLGILRTAGSGAGVGLNGLDLAPWVTPLTRLADLNSGGGMDLANGFHISNGSKAVTISTATMTTVEELLNAINGADVGALARINEAGDGIDVLNTLQGTTMSIFENSGTTAADLGIRSFSRWSPLSELNNGVGVRTTAGADLRVTRRDGTTFDVDIDGATSVLDVIDKITLADGGGGVTASFNSTANGIRLDDTTGGAGTLKIEALNQSLAMRDLGLDVAAAGNTLVGRDVGVVANYGLLGNLMRLRDAMVKSDQTAMTEAAEALQGDLTRVTRVAGQVGAQVKDLESRQEELDDQNVATQALLSQLEDVDFNEAVTRFQTLQTALQASLQTAGRMLNLSLLDFL